MTRVQVGQCCILTSFVAAMSIVSVTATVLQLACIGTADSHVLYVIMNRTRLCILNTEITRLIAGGNVPSGLGTVEL